MSLPSNVKCIQAVSIQAVKLNFKLKFNSQN